MPGKRLFEMPAEFNFYNESQPLLVSTLEELSNVLGTNPHNLSNYIHQDEGKNVFPPHFCHMKRYPEQIISLEKQQIKVFQRLRKFDTRRKHKCRHHELVISTN
jgi:hypothetical protein